MTGDPNLLTARDASTLTVTINRPSVLNALDAATLHALGGVMADARQDDGVRVVVVTGAGEKAFAAGADIKALSAAAPDEAREYSRLGHAVFDAIEQLGKPVIAAINGFALGGGCELAMACTLRVAADTATLGQPEINLGLLPGFGASQRLPRIVGKSRALELLLTGRSIAADEALRIGLVNRVVPAAQLMPAVTELARALASKPAVAVRYVLDAVSRGLEMSAADGQEYEAALFGLACATDDMREGTRAFLEKRTPAFKGR